MIDLSLRWQVVHGDCLDVMPTLGPVDAIVTDPPYGVALSNNDRDGHRSTRWGAIHGDVDQAVGLIVLENTRNRGIGTIIAFASPWKPWPGRWRNLIVWDKGGAVGGGGDITTCLKRTWELVQVWNTEPVRGGRVGSVWRYPITPADTADHIAAKPVALMRRLLSVFTSLDALVLDPFCGSGSTGVACIAEGRRFIGIEREAKYVEIARRRIADAAAQGSLFDDSTAALACPPEPR